MEAKPEEPRKGEGWHGVGERRWHALQAFALQSAGGAHGPHLWGAAIAGKGDLSYNSGNEQGEMQHCWELSTASGKEDSEERTSQGDVRKGEADVACAAGTACCCGKGTRNVRKSRDLPC